MQKFLEVVPKQFTLSSFPWLRWNFLLQELIISLLAPSLLKSIQLLKRYTPKNRRLLSFPTCLGSIRGRGRAAQMGCENQMPLWKAVSELRQPTPRLVPLITAEMTVLELPLGLSHGYPADELSGLSYPLTFIQFARLPGEMMHSPSLTAQVIAKVLQ